MAIGSGGEGVVGQMRLPSVDGAGSAAARWRDPAGAAATVGVAVERGGAGGDLAGSGGRVVGAGDRGRSGSGAIDGEPGGARATVAGPRTGPRRLMLGPGRGRVRPKPTKLESRVALHDIVEREAGGCEWSPEQIAGWLKIEYPDDAEMQVSHESIYRSLFVQTRGSLRKELTAQLRTKRAIRRPAGARQADGRGLRPNILNISQRPAEAADRAVPGHWEGDLVFGRGMSPVATLVERSTRFLMLVALPEGHRAELVADALAAKITTLPAALTRTLTWDQGQEMAAHARFTEETGIEVYFCDPKSPWQRGSNENTNGLLRQYLPRTVSMRDYTQADFDAIADQLNSRPRQTLGFKTPSQALAEVLR